MKPFQLPEEFIHLTAAGREVEVVHGVVLPVAAECDELAGLAFAKPLVELATPVTVAAHQPHGHLHVFFVGLLGQLEHPPRARPVDRHGLFHEHVHALLDRILEHWSPERRRRGEEGDIAGPQAVERLLVGLEPSEDPVVGHVDPILELLFDRPLDDLGTVGEHVRERHHAGFAAGHGERVDRRTAPAASAADHRDANLIAASSVHAGHCDTGQSGGSGDLPGGRTEELTAGGLNGRRGAGHERLRG